MFRTGAFKTFNCAKFILYHHQRVRYAGHSKWQNIKHIKAAKDAEKSLKTRRICQHIAFACKVGGGTNPVSNSQLSQVLAEARRLNIPASTVDNALKSAKEKKDNAQPAILELRGPSNSFVVVCLMTDNVNRIKNEINTILKKVKRRFVHAAIGSSEHYFNHKGLIEAINSSKQSLDCAENDAIEVGAEEVMEGTEPKNFQFICAPSALQTVRNKLEALGYEIISADEEYFPLIETSLEKEDLDLLDILYSKLQDIPEVTKLQNNVIA